MRCRPRRTLHSTTSSCLPANRRLCSTRSRQTPVEMNRGTSSAVTARPTALATSTIVRPPPMTMPHSSKFSTLRFGGCWNLTRTQSPLPEAGPCWALSLEESSSKGRLRQASPSSFSRECFVFVASVLAKRCWDRLCNGWGIYGSIMDNSIW